MIPLAIALATLASVCFALGARKQHAAVNPVAEKAGGLRLAQLGELLTRRKWVLGLVLATFGALLHVAALTLAPLAVVQPLGVLALPISVVLSARAGSWRLPAPALAGVVASVAGIAGFVALAASRVAAGTVPQGAELRTGLVAAALIGGLAGLATLTYGWLRCVALATGAGVAFGTVSTLLRATTQRLATTDRPWYLEPTVIGSAVGIAAGLLAGGWLVQQAFTSGPPELVIGCLTVIDPLIAVGFGTVFLGEKVTATPLALTGGLVCAGLAVAGVLLLARYHPEVAERTAHQDGRSP